MNTILNAGKNMINIGLLTTGVITAAAHHVTSRLSRTADLRFQEIKNAITILSERPVDLSKIAAIRQTLVASSVGELTIESRRWTLDRDQFETLGDIVLATGSLCALATIRPDFSKRATIGQTAAIGAWAVSFTVIADQALSSIQLYAQQALRAANEDRFNCLNYPALKTAHHFCQPMSALVKEWIWINKSIPSFQTVAGTVAVAAVLYQAGKHVANRRNNPAVAAQ
jgi:hypothetical protein